MKKLFVIIISGLALIAFTILAYGNSIIGSKHDLSTGDTETCAYCHTPHSGSTIAPLWNRQTPNPSSFTMYNSPTMDTSHPGQPNNISLACLSCHDGVNTDTDNHKLLNVPGSGLAGTNGDYSYPKACRCHDIYGSNPSLLTDTMYFFIGTDLSDEHPISINYPTSDQDPYFNTPAQVISGGLKLFGSNNAVECPSCHNVHDPQYTPFLRKSNAGSDLCLTCHSK